MSLNISESTEFKINELTLITKGGKLDIQGIFEELSIFDSILQPCISGQLLITDANGLANKLTLDGSEFLQVDIGKDSDELRLKKSFRIYKLSDRKNINQTSEMYNLHFVSDEYFLSEQQTLNQSYNGTYTEIAVKILTDKLKVPYSAFSSGFYNFSYGIKDFVVPNIAPLAAIEWMSKRAVNEKYIPDFFFFQNSRGFNFVSLSTLAEANELFTVNFDPKNLTDSVASELTGARDVKVISQYDLIDSVQSGVSAGQFIGFDPICRRVESKDITFSDIQDKMGHGNETPNLPGGILNRNNQLSYEAYGSRKTLSIFSEAQKYSQYIKKNDPQSINTLQDTQNFVFQRKAILKNLLQQRVRIVLPGNFAVSSGFSLFLKIPTRAVYDSGGFCSGGDNYDRTLYGKYVIIGTRHIIRYDRHETLVEVARDSSDMPYTPSANPEFKEASVDYGDWTGF
jgi:hypothetical protein